MNYKSTFFLFWLLLLNLPVWSQQVVEGLTVPVADRFNEGTTKGVYSAYKRGVLDQATQVIYEVRVTSDTSPAENKFAIHVAAVNAFPMKVKNLRTVDCMVGPYPARLIDGTGMAKSSTQILTLAIATPDKLYQFVQFSVYPTDNDDTFKKLGSFAVGEHKLTGYPQDYRGVYRLQGVPFGVLIPGYPYIHAFNKDSHYVASYHASASGNLPTGLHYHQFVCQLKPDDKRSDAQILFELAKEVNVPKTWGLDRFETPDGIVEGKDPENFWSYRFQLKRKENLVCVLLRMWPVKNGPLPMEGQIQE